MTLRQIVSSVDNHYVYVARCSDNTLYTGYTNDLERRIQQHNDGNGAKYTRSRTPITLVHVEIFDDKSSAMSREYEFKQLSKNDKESQVGIEGEHVSVRFRSLKK